jgi:hypothetical protein
MRRRKARTDNTEKKKRMKGVGWLHFESVSAK